jgi:hypothetical protein
MTLPRKPKEEELTQPRRSRLFVLVVFGMILYLSIVLVTIVTSHGLNSFFYR